MSIFDSPGITNTPSGQFNQNVSGYAAPYVQNMLNQTQALTSAPMPEYTGQLTAGPSDLQNQAFQGLSNLTIPTAFGTAQAGMADVAKQALYNPTFDSASAQQYMNPYIQNALAPAQQLLNQQYGMQSANQQAAATSKGAFGGSREAIMSGLGQQNQMLAQNQLVGNAYNAAFNNAQNQFNTANTQRLQGLQAATSANQALSQSGMNQGQLGLSQIQGQLAGGNIQQNLQQQALNAKYNQYLQQLQYPQTMAKLQSGILSGLPIQNTSTYGAQLSPFAQATGAASGIGSLIGSIPGASQAISNWWDTPSSPVGDLNPATNNTWATDLMSGSAAM